MLGFKTFLMKPHNLLCTREELAWLWAGGAGSPAGELGLFPGLMPVPLCFSVSRAEVVSHISRELSLYWPQSLLVSK